MDKITVKREQKRLIAILEKADVPKQQRDNLQPVVDNLAWQRVKLDEAMEAMQDEPLTVEYDNGGGQTGTRENPFFKAYVNLWRAYMVGFEKFTACLPKEMQDEIKGTISILDQVKQMKAK